MELKKQVDSLSTELIELRRDFHKHPELGFEERRTSEVISDYLQSIGLEVKQGIAKTGVIGLLKGKKAGRTLLLRADMDALPIQEENKVPYKSVNEGKMHACGHDANTAMLLVAAKVLSQHKDEISGNIKFVFQPAEEIGGGAKLMIEEGVLEDPRVDAAMGLHLNTPLESGKLAISAGPSMAACVNFQLTIEGKGGHTGYPQSAVDPIIAAANVITTTQIIQTREIEVFKPMLIMFGRIQGGSSDCVIPGKVELEGTIRYLYEGGEEDTGRFERIIEGICKAHRARYELKLVKAADLLNNDSRLVELIKACAEKLVKDQHDIVPVRTMGAEDFSEFTQKVPSAYYFIGTGNKEKETDYPHHHPRFNIDESTLSTGVEMHVRTALAYLSNENV